MYGVEIDSVTGEKTTFECTINWSYMPYGMPKSDEVYPMTMVFALCNNAITSIDDTLYIPIYAQGFNSDATTREQATKLQYPYVNGIYLFSSSDCGRTWNYLSQILVDDTTFNTHVNFEGLDEPMMEKMPDGSFVMLMRSGGALPSYISRSTDNGKTWSAPQVFDDIGVFPQIKTLDCGVTLASYGRPRLKVRASSDPAGLEWADPIEIPLSSEYTGNLWDRSCYYTGLLPIASNEALFIYSDFKCPNADGVPVKTILCRKITVKFD